MYKLLLFKGKKKNPRKGEHVRGNILRCVSSAELAVGRGGMEMWQLFFAYRSHIWEKVDPSKPPCSLYFEGVVLEIRGILIKALVLKMMAPKLVQEAKL